MNNSPLKIRVFINENVDYANNGLGKRYSVTKMCFDRKTGMTVDHAFLGTGYTFKEACALKHKVLEDYDC